MISKETGAHSHSETLPECTHAQTQVSAGHVAKVY